MGKASRRQRQCEICQATYRPTYGAQRTCSRDCGITLRRTVTNTMTVATAPVIHSKVCIECGRTFDTTRPQMMTCDTACRVAYRKRRASEYVKAGYHDGRYRDRMLSDAHMQRARKAGVAAEYISVAAIAERDDWMCGICGEPIPHEWDRADRRLMPSLDHIVPVAAGGPHLYSNVQIAHYVCNLVKHDKAAMSD